MHQRGLPYSLLKIHQLVSPKKDIKYLSGFPLGFENLENEKAFSSQVKVREF